MGDSGGIGMFTIDVLDGGDGYLVGCCDECVAGVDGGDENEGVSCDDGAGDNTDEGWCSYGCGWFGGGQQRCVCGRI